MKKVSSETEWMKINQQSWFKLDDMKKLKVLNLIWFKCHWDFISHVNDFSMTTEHLRNRFFSSALWYWSTLLERWWNRNLVLNVTFLSLLRWKISENTSTWNVTSSLLTLSLSSWRQRLSLQKIPWKFFSVNFPLIQMEAFKFNSLCFKNI